MINKEDMNVGGEYTIKIVRAASLVGGRTADECIASGEFESVTKKNRVFRSWYNHIGLLGGGSGDLSFYWQYLGGATTCRLVLTLINGNIDEGLPYETSQASFGGFSSQVSTSWEFPAWGSSTLTETGRTLSISSSRVISSATTVTGVMLASMDLIPDTIQGVGQRGAGAGNLALSLVKLSNSIPLGVGDTIYITYKLSTFFVGDNWRRNFLYRNMHSQTSGINNYRYLVVSDKLPPVDPTRVMGSCSSFMAPSGAISVATYNTSLTNGISGSVTRNSNTEYMELGTSILFGADVPLLGVGDVKLWSERPCLGWNSISKSGTIYRSQVIKRKSGRDLLVDGSNPPTGLANLITSGGSQIRRNVLYNTVVQTSGASSTVLVTSLTITSGLVDIISSVNLTGISTSDNITLSCSNTSLGITAGLYLKVINSTTVRLATSQADATAGTFITPTGSEVVLATLSLATVAVISSTRDSSIEAAVPYVWSEAYKSVGRTVYLKEGSNAAGMDVDTSTSSSQPGRLFIWTSYDSISKRMFHGIRNHGKGGTFEHEFGNLSAAIVSWNYNTIENGFEEELVVGTSCGDCYNGTLVVGFFGNKIRQYDVSTGYTFIREVSTSAPVYSVKFDTTTGLAWLHLLGVGIAKYNTNTGVITEYNFTNTFTTLAAANFNLLTKSLDVHNGMVVLGYNSRLPTRNQNTSNPPASVTGINLGQIIFDSTTGAYGVLNLVAVGNYGTPRWVVPSRGTDRNKFIVSFIEHNRMHATPQTDPQTVCMYSMAPSGTGAFSSVIRDSPETITFGGVNDSWSTISSPVMLGMHSDDKGLSIRFVSRGAYDGYRSVVTYTKPTGGASVRAQDTLSTDPTGAAIWLSENPGYTSNIAASAPVSVNNIPETAVSTILRANGSCFNQTNCLYIEGILHVLKGVVLLPVPKVEYLGPAVNLTLPSSGLNVTFQNAGGFPSTSQLVAGECYNFGVGPAIMKTGLTTVTFPYAFPTRPTREVTFTGISPSGAPGTVQPAETLTRWFHDVFLGAPMTITVNGTSRVRATAAPTAGQVWVDILGKITFHSSDYSQPYSITCTCQEQFN